MPRFLPLLALAAIGGCATYTCTLIACVSGLTVTFSRVPTAPYHIEARTADGGGGMFVYDCPDISRCSPSPLLEGYLPGSAVFTVTYQGRTASTTVSPDYTQVTPNGRDCGPSCTQGKVALTLP
jgi:hypothetical protein